MRRFFTVCDTSVRVPAMRDFQRPGRSAAYAANGMAATSSPLATLAALDVLKAGGNAVDAAVTASAVLCITEPHMTGIGGDCFALIGLPDGSVKGLNGSGRAAMAADAQWLKKARLTEIAPDSVHAVTVPGAVDAWDELLRAHGTIDLSAALRPAINLAETGVPITPRVAYDWPDEVTRLAGDEGGRRHFLIGGRAPRAGETMRYPAMAKTLRRIAEGGRDEFYRGAIAEEIVAVLAARGGLLRGNDFERHSSTWVEPIATRFAGRDILEIPPNGQGLTALIALNILSRFDLTKHAPIGAARYHLETEAMKSAWVLRNRHIADPDFAKIPIDDLLGDRIADSMAAKIDPKRASAGARELKPASDTVYLCVIDKDRLAVSFINSIYWSFGSSIVTPESGIALQNRGAGFVTDPGHPNCIGPGKRPLHTIIPAMAKNEGRIDMSFGVMGGAYQPMGHVAVAVNRYVYGMDPQEAIDHPRLFPEAGLLRVEAGIPAQIRGELTAMGHVVVEAGEPLGGGQAIAVDWGEGTLTGGSDPRKDGCALGY
jgi:gamma-glutamyltranspeptidase/glutathione hydrolase